MVTQEEVMKELNKVIDPEIGLPLTALNLVDYVKIDGGNVAVRFHLTAPFCPPVFALNMAMQVRELTRKLPGVSKVHVEVAGHAMEEEINQRLAALEDQPAPTGTEVAPQSNPPQHSTESSP